MAVSSAFPSAQSCVKSPTKRMTRGMLDYYLRQLVTFRWAESQCSELVVELSGAWKRMKSTGVYTTWSVRQRNYTSMFVGRSKTHFACGQPLSSIN